MPEWIRLVAVVPAVVVGWPLAFAVTAAFHRVAFMLCPSELIVSGACTAPWFNVVEFVLSCNICSTCRNSGCCSSNPRGSEQAARCGMERFWCGFSSTSGDCCKRPMLFTWLQLCELCSASYSCGSRLSHAHPRSFASLVYLSSSPACSRRPSEWSGLAPCLIGGQPKTSCSRGRWLSWLLSLVSSSSMPSHLLAGPPPKSWR